MKGILRSVSVVLALASAPQAVAAEDMGGPAAPQTVPMPPEASALLLDMVVLWLASNFGLPPSFEHPALAFASAEELARLRYGEDAAHDAAEVVAVYSDAEGAIYLGEGWDGRTPAGLSVIVHEMVHHLQDAAGMRFACPGEREILAYEAQERWLEMFGRNLASEFQMDAMTRMLRTTCAY